MATSTDNSEFLQDAPTNELGRGVGTTLDLTGKMPWGAWVDDAENALELKWPRSVEQYDNMRNDSQCQGLYLGATAAIVRYGWYINPNDCEQAWVDLLAADLNLPVGEDAAREQFKQGQKRAKLRTSQRFSWYTHLQTALKAMAYGYYYFEQVGEITSDGPGGRQIWRLRKLGPRHPRTITEIVVADDGGLVFVQQGWGWNAQEPPRIPVDRLVCYVWDQEPGNWVGRSIFRPMYRNWLCKDRLMRVDAIKHERNGVGMPIIEAPEGATGPQIQQLDRMAQEFKAGERGGGAVPYGTKLRLVGTEGSLPDTVASIRFHNEEMARSMLMMFMQLGQTESGSRALGQTFLDWFSLQQEMIADWIADTGTEHIIEDWWSWNVDPEAIQTPQLAYIKGPESDATMGDFSGAQLPNSFQREGGIKPESKKSPPPSKQPKTTQAAGPHPTSQGRGFHSGSNPSLHGPVDPSPTGNGAATHGNGHMSAQTSVLEVAAPLSLPARQLRRQPYAQEIQAQTDFARLDSAFESGQQNLVDEWRVNVQAAQVAAVGEEIARTSPSNLEALGRLRVPVLGEDILLAALSSAAQDALNAAQGEMLAQGVNPPDIEVDEASLRSRARGMASMLASNLAGSARRNAMRMSSEDISASALADEVTIALGELSTSWLSDQLGGSISAAQNQARLMAFTSGGGESLWASELLDRNTCGPCIAVDGRLLTRAEANRLYASGGYIYCEGGERCRGTVIATFG